MTPQPVVDKETAVSGARQTPQAVPTTEGLRKIDQHARAIVEADPRIRAGNAELERMREAIRHQGNLQEGNAETARGLIAQYQDARKVGLTNFWLTTSGARGNMLDQAESHSALGADQNSHRQEMVAQFRSQRATLEEMKALELEGRRLHLTGRLDQAQEKYNEAARRFEVFADRAGGGQVLVVSERYGREQAKLLTSMDTAISGMEATERNLERGRKVCAVAGATVATIATAGGTTPLLVSAAAGTAAGTGLGAMTNAVEGTGHVLYGNKTVRQAAVDAGRNTLQDAGDSAVAAGTTALGIGVADRFVAGGKAATELTAGGKLLYGTTVGASSSSSSYLAQTGLNVATGRDERGFGAEALKQRGVEFGVTTAVGTVMGATGSGAQMGREAAKTLGGKIAVTSGEALMSVTVGVAAAKAQGEVNSETVTENVSSALLGAVQSHATMNVRTGGSCRHAGEGPSSNVARAIAAGAGEAVSSTPPRSGGGLAERGASLKAIQEASAGSPEPRVVAEQRLSQEAASLNREATQSGPAPSQEVKAAPAHPAGTEGAPRSAAEAFGRALHDFDSLRTNERQYVVEKLIEAVERGEPRMALEALERSKRAVNFDPNDGHRLTDGEKLRDSVKALLERSDPALGERLGQRVQQQFTPERVAFGEQLEAAMKSSGAQARMEALNRATELVAQGRVDDLRFAMDWKGGMAEYSPVSGRKLTEPERLQQGLAALVSPLPADQVDLPLWRARYAIDRNNTQYHAERLKGLLPGAPEAEKRASAQYLLDNSPIGRRHNLTADDVMKRVQLVRTPGDGALGLIFDAPGPDASLGHTLPIGSRDREITAALALAGPDGPSVIAHETDHVFAQQRRGLSLPDQSVEQLCVGEVSAHLAEGRKMAAREMKEMLDTYLDHYTARRQEVVDKMKQSPDYASSDDFRTSRFYERSLAETRANLPETKAAVERVSSLTEKLFNLGATPEQLQLQAWEARDLRDLAGRFGALHDSLSRRE